MTISVLNISLDSQIAWDPSRAALGDPADRQRRYASHLSALHVVVKTGLETQRATVPLAGNAWAYPTRSPSRYTFLWDAYRIGASICGRERIDLISAQDPFATGLAAWLLARRYRKPLNVQLHFDVLDNPHWIAERSEHRLLNTLGKWLVRQADTVRVGTRREASRLAGWGIASDRIHVAPVPVDVAAFSAASAVSPQPNLILSASRLVPQKDLPMLLRAFRLVRDEIHDAELAIAGDGPLRSDLERLVAALGIAAGVEFLGLVDRREMPKLMASCAALAVSSLYEGTSLVTVQAGAVGRPVVTTDVAGAADTVVDGQTGIVVPIGDAEAMARALTQLLVDPERARRMGESARRHVAERYATDRAVSAVVEMWTQTAARRRDRGRWLYLANVRVPSEKAHVYQIFQMLDAFREARVDVTLVHPRRANLDSLEGADPVSLYGLRHPPKVLSIPTIDSVRLVTVDLPALKHRPVPQLAFALQAATFTCGAAIAALRGPAEVVYSRDWPVLAIALLAGRTCVWEAHDLPGGGLARAALRRALTRFSAAVAISEGVRGELVALGMPADRILLAPDAVDLRRFESAPGQAAARAQLGLRQHGRHVVYAGHLYPWKGVHTLALASQRLASDVEVVIVGGTPADIETFRCLVKGERLDRVRVVGYVPPSEVPNWLAAADVLALPNSAREAISSRYTSPLKLFEYMAAGRPIVASDLPSLREVLQHGQNAWLVAPDDPEALAGGIRALLDDRVTGQRIARRARRDVEGRTWTARAQAIVHFVERITA